ncbi:hypothetical protein EV127DRAFT_503359 [Xylaria flabelliformis]|nr:hypothetical protein EV127DRAFT_503359 [Xylaria flabelliformis]
MLKRLQIPSPQSCYEWYRGHDLRRRAANYSGIWVSMWLWEILSIVLSGICIILIFVILKIHNQKPVPHFAYGITLNAIISTLTTFSKSLLLVSVAAAISQLKWHRFQNKEGRRIIDTQRFDDASRGPWGSLVFLAGPSRWSLASMGALVSILALAFEPFTQQLTTYPVRKTMLLTPGAGSLNLHRAKHYPDVYQSDSEINDAYGNIENRMAASIWDLSDEATSFATPQCPTGNCTWEEFESLAFCTSCQNKTSDIKLSGASLSWDSSSTQQMPMKYVNPILDMYDLPEKGHLHLSADFPCRIYNHDLIISGKLYTSGSKHVYPGHMSYPRHVFLTDVDSYGAFLRQGRIAFLLKDGVRLNSSDDSKWQSYRLPLLKFCHIELERADHDGIERISVRQATACHLEPCIKRYSFSVSNGIPMLDTLGERYGFWYVNATTLKYFNDTFYYVDTGAPFEGPDLTLGLSWADVPVKDGLVLSDEHSKTSFLDRSSMGYSFDWKDLTLFRRGRFQYQGKVFVNEEFTSAERNHIMKNSSIQFKKEFLTASRIDIQDIQTLTLRQIADKGGLTWAIPRIAAAASRHLRDKDAIPVPGYAYTSSIIVEARWPWLILPVTIWISGAMFLVLTMWFCRGNDRLLWKTSSLPLIYHGFQDHDVEYIKITGEGLENVSGMEKYSQHLHARIRRDSIDGRLKLTRTLPLT